MESLVIAGIGVLVALFLLLLGVPVAFALGITGLLGITALSGTNITEAYPEFSRSGTVYAGPPYG